MNENPSRELSNIAKRLRMAREYMGFSQDDIEKITGLDTKIIEEIETGAREIVKTEIHLLSKVYRRSVDYLLTGQEPSYSGPEQFSFLARSTKGLTEHDIEEVAQFAKFLNATKTN